MIGVKQKFLQVIIIFQRLSFSFITEYNFRFFRSIFKIYCSILRFHPSPFNFFLPRKCAQIPPKKSSFTSITLHK